MEAIDIILICLSVITTISFGTMFIIVVRRILEGKKYATENKNEQQPALPDEA